MALVDLDVPFGDVALMLDMHPEQDILDALADGVVDDLERLQKLLVRTPARRARAARRRSRLTTRATLDSRKVGQLLTRLAALHQFVLVDTPVD